MIGARRVARFPRRVTASLSPSPPPLTGSTLSKFSSITRKHGLNYFCSMSTVQGKSLSSQIPPKDKASSTSTSQTSSTRTPPWPGGGTAPHRWWKDKNNQKIYLVPLPLSQDWLGHVLGFESREDWYKVTSEHFLENFGRTLLDRNASSPSRIVASIYTDFEYLPWLFERLPRQSYFKDRSNRLRYIEWLLRKTGVKSKLELTTRHFMENGGGRLLLLYDGSPLKVINSLEDEKIPLESLKRKPREYWRSEENLRKLLDRIGVDIGVRDGDLSPWYTVTFEEFVKLTSPGIKNIYKSMYPMLSAAYPDYEWIPWKFPVTPKSLIDDEDFINSALDEVEKKLKIVDHEGWYRVSTTQLGELGLSHLLARKHGSLFETLSKFRPHIRWDESKFIGAAHSRRSRMRQS